MNTYGQLKTAIANWIDREDQTSNIPDFINLAEREIYRGLTVADNQFEATYTQTEWYIDAAAPIATSPGIFEALPPNFSVLKLVKWNGRPLKSVTDTELAERLFTEYDDSPSAFCITARKIAFSSAPDTDSLLWQADDTLVISYYGTESLSSYPTWQVATNPVEYPAVEDITPQVTTGTEDNTTRMLQRNPDVYLHGSLYFAALLLQDDDAAKKWGGLFMGALKALKAESKRNMYAGSPKQIRSAYS